MKTKTTISALEQNNEFGISKYQDYARIEVTASEGKESATMAFPWAHTIPFGDVTVQNAINKCQETTKKSLVMHLERRESRNQKRTAAEKFFAFLRREVSYALSMTRIGGGRE